MNRTLPIPANILRCAETQAEKYGLSVSDFIALAVAYTGEAETQPNVLLDHPELMGPKMFAVKLNGDEVTRIAHETQCVDQSRTDWRSCKSPERHETDRLTETLIRDGFAEQFENGELLMPATAALDMWQWGRSEGHPVVISMRYVRSRGMVRRGNAIC